MEKEKQIQIPQELFDLMVTYILSEESRTEDNLKEIKRGIQDKLDRIIDHQLYTKYKKAPTEEQREKARQEYLERRCISAKFRW